MCLVNNKLKILVKITFFEILFNLISLIKLITYWILACSDEL